MTTIGYSDRINHALAFAAKHHDQQVRRGTRAPYLTQPANVAIILTRYGQSDETVIAGILHDAVEDARRTPHGQGALARIAAKFGEDVLDQLLSVTLRGNDDDGVELDLDERRDDCLARLASAPEPARWVCAADKLHTGSTILSDLARTDYPETVWQRFAAGQEGTVRWYRRVHDRLREVGFDAPIMDELRRMVEALERLAEPAENTF
jgi:(p)ppGpp synthase/HD superfamily hydrolase